MPNLLRSVISQSSSINRRAVCALVAGGLMSILSIEPSRAQMDTVHKAMADLKAQTAKLGPAKTEGTDTVAGKTVPALYFGTYKMNNNFDVVDAVAKEHGGTATLFVKAGEEYVRVATNVLKPDGTRAIGTVLDPNGPVIAKIKNGEAYYGDTTVLDKPYVTGYEPIQDIAGNTIGIYYVGYPKS